jgi:hypothetical protein
MGLGNPSQFIRVFSSMKTISFVLVVVSREGRQSTPSTTTSATSTIKRKGVSSTIYHLYSNRWFWSGDEHAPHVIYEISPRAATCDPDGVEVAEPKLTFAFGGIFRLPPRM